MRIESSEESVDMGKSPLFKNSPPSFSKEKFFNSTGMVNEYTSPHGDRNKVKKTLFEKIKPIMKSFKNNKPKKPKMKEVSTSMDETLSAISEYEQFYSLTPTGISPSASKVSFLLTSN